MDDIWAYPYKLGIGLFLVIGTLLLMGFFIGLTIWLERAFKKEELEE